MNQSNHQNVRADFELISQWIKSNETVLDLGCENGDLLSMLQSQKKCKTLGIEINTTNVNHCIAKGVEVIQANLDDGLDLFDDNSFDVVVMTETIQALYNPIGVLKEMIRIGNRCIITFPNFAHLAIRSYLFLKGKMPITKELTYQWHNTPNIHFCTVNDFETTCKENNITVLNRKFIGKGGLLVNQLPNLLAKTAIYQLKNQ